MSTNKQKQSKIKFDHNWSGCSTDNIDINDNLNWISIQLPHIIDKNEQEEFVDTHTDKTSNTLPIRKNRVLDYLVGFNDTDGRFDISFSLRLKTPTISQLPYPSNRIEQENIESTSDRNSNTLTPNTKHGLDYLVNFNHIDPISSKHENSPEEFDVPRLTIVMLIVGTRGDVQPFVA
jgi:hypothetical protein